MDMFDCTFMFCCLVQNYLMHCQPNLKQTSVLHKHVDNSSLRISVRKTCVPVHFETILSQTKKHMCRCGELAAEFCSENPDMSSLALDSSSWSGLWLETTGFGIRVLQASWNTWTTDFLEYVYCYRLMIIRISYVTYVIYMCTTDICKVHLKLTQI